MLDDPELRVTRYRVEIAGLTLFLVPTEPGFAGIEVTLAPAQAYALAYQLETNALLALAAGDLAVAELEALTSVDRDV